MKITGLDHLVLTVRDLERTCDFYRRILGMGVIVFGEGRRALTFGNQKINLHQAGREFKPNAEAAAPGTGDLCFVTETPIDEVVATLNEFLVPIELGPVPRTGARGNITSVYCRDPDQNLIEISRYEE